MGFSGTGNIAWSILIMFITGWLSFGPKPIVDSILSASNPQLRGDVPLVVRGIHEDDSGVTVSPDIISMFASDNGVGRVTFLDDLFSSSTNQIENAIIGDLDGTVRRIRIDGKVQTVPSISLSVPSISASQLIQLRPDALAGSSLIIAGEVGETMVDTASGRLPLWQVFANTVSLSSLRITPPLISFFVAVVLFVLVSVSSTKTLLVTAIATLTCSAYVSHSGWLPPYDPMTSAMVGGTFVARAAQLRLASKLKGSELTSHELAELHRFSGSSVRDHECLAAWIVLMDAPNAPHGDIHFSTICSHGDTVEMPDSQIAELVANKSAVDSSLKPWSVFPIKSERGLKGSLFLITQPNDQHNRKTKGDIVHMVASFCVTDPAPDDTQSS